MSIISIFISVIFPISPTQQLEPRPQHSVNAAVDEINTNGAISVAIKCLFRIVRIALNPYVIKRHDERGFEAWFSRSDTIAGKADDAFYSNVRWIGWGPIFESTRDKSQTYISTASKKKKKKKKKKSQERHTKM